MDILFGKRKIAACICNLILILLVISAFNLVYANIFVLVSSSLPKSSLKQYLIDAEKFNAQIVLQGLVRSSLKDTASLILNAQAGGLSIDPIIFSKLDVQKIPAIIKFNARGLDCLKQKDCVPDKVDYDIVYGNISLDYALKLFARSHV